MLNVMLWAIEFFRATVWAVPTAFLFLVLWVRAFPSLPQYGLAIAVFIAVAILVWQLKRRMCVGCGKLLNLHIVSWEEALSDEQRLNIESYVESSKLFQCKKCRRLQCLDCAMKANLKCRTCGGFTLRTGYFAATR